MNTELLVPSAILPFLFASADEDETRLLYDRKSAARQLSISVRSLDSLIASKQLTTRRIGKRVLIPRGVLVKFASRDTYAITAA